jgi:hypothetical protein
LLTGGERIGNTGNFYQPTVLSRVPTTARAMNEEPFGPLALMVSTPVKNRRYLPQFGLTGGWLVQVVHRRAPPP